MAAALSMATRRRIIQGYRAGTSYAALAKQFNVAYHSVRTLCLRVEAEGEDGLRPRYDRCGVRGPQGDRLIYRAACCLKRRHPQWGAAFIRLQLEARYGPERPLPAVRTMQHWFKEKGLQPPRSKPPQVQKQWASHVHQVWQIDAKEQQRTADGTEVCWLTVTDEHSTAILGAPVFSLTAYQSGPAPARAAGLDCPLSGLGAAAGDQG